MVSSFINVDQFSVAPLAGAWIEMPCTYRKPIGPEEVAPLAGAWIEIMLLMNKKMLNRGRTPRGCVD